VEAFAAFVAAARAAWPSIRLDEDRFVAHVASKLDPALPSETALAGLRAADLWLACGCGWGDAAALAAFDRELIPGLDPVLGSLQVGPRADEIKQQLRIQLLAGTEPDILSYGGRGELRAWLRTCAVRCAYRMLRQDRRDVVLDEDLLLALPAPDDDPETERLKRVYAPEFKEALRTALAGLSPRDRNLLRQAFIDGLTVDQLGALYRVHRATAARWVSAARAAVLAETERLLRERLHIDQPELESLWRLVRSRLDLSAF
jgi:RNA polymerase sigma-70 factor (ECF subfamily)